MHYSLPAMRKITAIGVALVAVVGALRIPGLPWEGLVAVVVAAGVMAWRVSLCPHAGPLALLPATTDLDGSPLPVRWYCDDCGRAWAANFDKDSTPVKKFTGYDESKAVTSAKRAAEHAEQQRHSAMKRAGLRPSLPARDLRVAK